MPRLPWFDTPLHALMRELRPRELMPLAGAIFLMFSVLGPVTDLFSGARHSLTGLLENTVFSGVIALGYAFGFLRRSLVLLAVSVAAQAGWIASGGSLPGSHGLIPPEALPSRLATDALLTLLSMVGSYTCFLSFISGTSTRYLRVRAEMELAHQIHQVLVPPIAVTHGEFEFGGISIPSGEVGGDLVDVVARDGAWLGYVADVSGHGVSSGVVMGMFKSALHMRLLHPGPLSALLDDLNVVLFPLKSSSMFVTAVCVRGRTGGTLEYAVAGHLPILRVRANTREVEEITTLQIPVGMFEDYRFTSSTLECGHGDLLALITDGLTEVFDAKDDQFGMEAVKALLARVSEHPLAEISREIVAAARAHGVQIDDQTLLLIRRL